ncbi:MAG: endolytic transglycosylase MltG, partial [Thiohalorhabdaceae bacterium]
GLTERGHDSAEGWLFPETYRFSRGHPAEAILTKAHDRMRAILKEEWAGRAADLPLDSAYEALILASIVEKETAVPSERPLIASVFVNRLRDGMRLQTDPTVIYGMGDSFDGNLQRQDLRRPTPYNTYTSAGLPPTPIANPGRAAIKAACQPADSDYRYFVSRGDGSHVFSETLDEHNRAVRRYQLGEH